MDTQEQQTAVQSPVFSDEHVPAARHAYTWALLNLVIFWVIDMAVKIVLSKVVPKDVPEFVSQIITFAPMYLIAFPVYLLLSKRLTATVPEKHKMNVGQILLAATCAEFLGIAGNIIGTIVNFALTLLLGHRTDETFLAEGVFGSSSILFVLTAVVIAPVIEEMMFRNWTNDPEVCRFLSWEPHGDISVTRAFLAHKDCGCVRYCFFYYLCQ